MNRLYLCVIIVLNSLAHASFNIQNITETRSFLKRLIRPGDLVFDVGANIGKKTEIYLTCGAHVVCFEPQECCIQELSDKFRYDPRVHIDPRGLASYIGIISFFTCPEFHVLATCSQSWMNDSRYASRVQWEAKHEIPVTTLDAMIAQYGLPQFCKIDVEGFELDVLKGLTQRIPYISFEFHIERNDSSKECIHYLTSIGYTRFNIGIAERGIFLSQQWLSADEMVQRLNQELYNPLWNQIGGLWGDIYATY